ncbi:MAG: FkbM family methyltransferase [Pseudomonadota bacterium]
MKIGKKRIFPFAEKKAIAESYDAVLQLHYAIDEATGDRVFVSDKKRLELYRKGKTHRLDWLVGDYRLPADLIRPGDVVLDVGANIGELGLWAVERGADYIAFELDPVAFRALQSNVPGHRLYDVALSDTDGTATFYLNTAEADSSLFKPQESDASIEVRTALLDGFLQETGAPERIRLFKVEAEGMEPEVLAGASDTLERVEYLAVDAGPERGGENTVPPVFNAVSQAGFELLDCFLLRGRFLFRNRAFAADPS